MKERTVYVQALYELVELKKAVDPWDLMEACEAIYKSSKAVGIDKTTIKYVKKGKTVVKNATNIPEEARAIVGLVVKLIYRWTDDYSGRLEKHLGLNMRIDYILGNTRLFANSHAALQHITVQDVIDSYLNIA